MLRLSRFPLLILALAQPAVVLSQTRPFPVPAGIENAVEFWKQIFTRYSFGEVVLFDPMARFTAWCAHRQIKCCWRAKSPSPGKRQISNSIDESPRGEKLKRAQAAPARENAGSRTPVKVAS